MGVETLVIGGLIAASSVKAQREQRKANRAAERAERARSARERAGAIRAARAQSAEFINAQAARGGVASGQLSSSTSGQLGALQTSLASNIGFANQLDNLRAQQFRAQERAATAQLVGNLVQQAAPFVPLKTAGPNPNAMPGVPAQSRPTS